MSRLLSAVSLGIAVTAAVGAVTASVEFAPVHRAPTHRPESADAGRVIVKFRERASVLSASASASTGGVRSGPQSAAVLGSRMGLALTDGRILGPRTQVMKVGGMTSSTLATTLAQDPDVEWAEVDHRRFVQTVPNDALYAGGQLTTTPTVGQWYLRAPDATVKSSIDIEPAWAVTTGSTAIVIADVDTGITAHPDLDSKMLPGYDFISEIPTANDLTARDSDPSDPGDFVTAAENSLVGGTFFGCNDNGTGAAVAENSSWHGTQTAGILGAATNNATGMAGTAWNTPVVAARALGKCGGYDSDIIAAAQWAGGLSVSGVSANAHPARVVNMSLGAAGACGPAYRDALTLLRNHGVFVVAAAGNEEGLPVLAPANCQPAATDPDQTPIVIAVAGLRHVGTKVGFSDIGPEVTIAAPGGNCVNTSSSAPCLYPILTASNKGTTTPVLGGGTYTNSYGSPSLGTSFSTPLVSGTVALMLSVAPNLTNAQLIDLLKSTARPFPTTSDTVPTPAVCTVPTATSPVQDECLCTTSTCGAGMLDAGAAVLAAQAATAGTGPTAVITPGNATVAVGSSVTLSGATSTLGSGGAGIVKYQWTIADADTFVTLGASTGASVVVTGAAAGTGQVQLTVTDANGSVSSATVSVTVTAASSPAGGGSTSSSGGGAANPAWLAALALAGWLLGPRARRSRSH